MLFCVISNSDRELLASSTTSLHSCDACGAPTLPHQHARLSHKPHRHTQQGSHQHRRRGNRQKNVSGQLFLYTGGGGRDQLTLSSSVTNLDEELRHPQGCVSCLGNQGLRPSQRSKSLGDLLTTAHAMPCGQHGGIVHGGRSFTNIHAGCDSDDGWKEPTIQESSVLCEDSDKGYSDHIHDADDADDVVDLVDDVSNEKTDYQRDESAGRRQCNQIYSIASGPGTVAMPLGDKCSMYPDHLPHYNRCGNLSALVS